MPGRRRSGSILGLNSECTLVYWAELVKALKVYYGPPKYLNPDEHLCNIKKIGTITEYHQEWVKRMARVTKWSEHYLFGSFLKGLSEELRSKVRVHEPRMVYKAANLALEFEKKLFQVKGPGPVFILIRTDPLQLVTPLLLHVTREPHLKAPTWFQTHQCPHLIQTEHPMLLLQQHAHGTR